MYSKIFGDVRKYIFANVTLLDGHWYKVKIIGCNGADLCTQTETEEQLIDNSPPTPGAFAVETDHAINLERHRHGYMVYNRNVISIAFLGFADPHVGIQDYHVTVGTHYDGADLIPGSSVRVYHYGQEGHRDEGSIERANITLSREVEPEDLLYITIWAVNKVGLTSRRLHGSFVAIPSFPGTGRLELNRRCLSWSCRGHCTCSPQDQRCLDVSSCSNVTGFEGYQVLSVTDVDVSALGSSEDKAFTFVTCVMAAAWEPMGTGRTPIRYEWSVGERGAAPGTGLINRASGVVWRDNGQLTSGVFSVKHEKQMAMIPGTVYVFHVRAWYDDVHYGMFSSDGITADNHGLQVARTAVPKEVSRLGSRKDIDVISDPSTVNVTWKHVFLTGSTPLSYVTVCIGSTYGNADVIQNDYSPTVTEATITGLNLMERTQYYTTVHAVDKDGLHVSAHSDGFVVDLTKPLVLSVDVNDGSGVTDLKYCSTNSTISANWRGFNDLESALDEYIWCAYSSKGENIVPCVPVGFSLSSRKTLTPENQLIHGETYFSKVQVLDGAGHASDFVESDGFTVDISSPELAGHITGNNLVIDGSFESGIFPRNWTVVDGSAVVWFAAAKHGERALLIRGTVMQAVPPCACKRAKLTFFSLPLLNGTAEDRTFLGKVQINHAEYLFDIHNDNTSWTKHVYFVTSDEDQNLNLSFTGSPFLLDSVSVLPMIQETNTSLSTVTVHVVPGPIYGLCHVTATWSMYDPESSIKEYEWAVGTVRGGVQLQSFKSVATRNHARLSSVTLTQGSSVHVTIQATNGAGLASVVYSQPVKVDYTAPEICCVLINGQAGNDTSYVTGYMKVEWLVTEPETSVKLCEWSLGTSPGVSDIKGIAPALDNKGEANVTELTHGEIFYVNVRCENTNGMTSYLSTQAVVLVTGPPHSKNVRLAPIISSPSVYPARGHHQSVTESLRLAWSGFQDNSGISHYELHLAHGAIVLSDWITVAVHPVQFCDLADLELIAYKTYVVSLRAVNHAGYSSESVTSRFTVETTHPYITGKPLESYFNPHSTVHVNWNEMFISNSTLMYEVNVGTREGGCDVVCRLETTDSWLTLTNVDSSLQHYISIIAVNKAGLATAIGQELNSG